MIPFAFQLIPGGLLLFGILLVPESPRWMARNKGREAAINTLAILRGLPHDDSRILEETAVIMAEIEEELSSVQRSGIIGEFQELFGQPMHRKRMMLGVLIFVFMQFAGSNAINVSVPTPNPPVSVTNLKQFYSPRIFKSIGLTGANTQLISTGAYGTVRFIVVCITSYFLVDRFGRTTLLLIGSIGMVRCFAAAPANVRQTLTTFRQSACFTSAPSSI